MRRDWRNVHAGKRGVGGAERGFILVHNGAGQRCERVQARLAARATMVYSWCTVWVGGAVLSHHVDSLQRPRRVSLYPTRTNVTSRGSLSILVIVIADQTQEFCASLRRLALGFCLLFSFVSTHAGAGDRCTRVTHSRSQHQY